MRRVVSLFLPNWSTDRIVRKLRQQPDRSAHSAASLAPASAPAPLVTALPDHGRRVVASVDRAARALGIRPGMTLTQARGFAPDLLVIDGDPEEDFEGLKRLALWATRHYSPVAAPDPPDGIWIDITGCAERFGGEAPLIKHLYRRVLASGFTAQIAVADTAGCAHAVARQVPSGRPTIIEPGKARSALAILPVHALRLGPGVADELRRMGFERVEQLMAAARAPLAKRFGLQLHKRLDQALGHLPEPIEPIFAADVPRTRRSLLEPIGTAEAFAHVIGDLTTDLAALLLRAGLGARHLDLYVERVDGHWQAIRVGTAKPSRDPAHLAKLLGQKIDTIEPGMGVEAMTLVSPLTEPLAGAQADALAARRGPDLPALIDALANRFGARHLYQATARSSSMPEREIDLVPPLGRAAPEGWDAALPRPSRMIVPPEKVEVTAMLPDHPPAMFVWRGKRYRVARADGPERLHGEWWQSEGLEVETPLSVRDYFQVETADGGRYWIYRLGDGTQRATGPMSWFIHGAFA
ncbi:DUF6504 family protein [Novosphingobium terrae]|uniref:DUF6504 family protein n=1 Tax=Novosphingobium terrae TaxID=2726189 RepID=UPI00198098F2|nr:DUF6504 family protein [Novosphingobium terrae]